MAPLGYFQEGWVVGHHWLHISAKQFGCQDVGLLAIGWQARPRTKKLFRATPPQF